MLIVPRRLAFAVLAAILGSCAAPKPDGAADADMGGKLTGDASGDSVAAAPTKVDFLWVVDHSPSMSARQADLANGFQAFADSLKAGKLDAQMAVVSVQQMADKDLTAPLHIGKAGQFLHKAATKLSPCCTERFRMPCANDGQCQTGMDYMFKNDTACPQSSSCVGASGSLQQHFDNPFPSLDCGGDPSCQWRCKAPEKAIYSVNDNCSINSYCWRHCTQDQECRNVFEPGVPTDKQRMKCVHPGGVPSEQSLCQMPLATEDCPGADALPAVLSSNQLDKFHCLASIGSAQTQESKFEGGLRSAWLALDPKGPNCLDAAGQPTPECQTKQLLRPDALLVIVVVSDDDDCSVIPTISLDNSTPAADSALKKALPLEVWASCQNFGDRLGANAWLNAGNCEYLKGKPGMAKVCPCDCAAMTAGSAEQLKCNAEVQTDWLKFAKIDSRFATAADYAWRFKTLKANPNLVLFAAVTGDSLAQATGTIEGDRAAFYKSLLKNVATLQSPSICNGPRGAGGFGSRYEQVAATFQDNGMTANLCAGASLSGQLQQVAAFVQAHTLAAAKPCADKDGDGIADSACGGSDCDDNNAAVAPGLKEACGNAIDDDCDGITDHDVTYGPDLAGGNAILSDLCLP